MMKILLLLDNNLPINQTRLLSFLNRNLSHITFELFQEDFSIKEEILAPDLIYDNIYNSIDIKWNTFNRALCFTDKPYSDNYFFYGNGHLTIFSFYEWSHLTDLPISNGVLYFIIDILALDLDKTNFRHKKNTGCIYDFLREKKGIDDGMRQARFCTTCLNRLTQNLKDKNSVFVFKDLEILMDNLSNSSRWNKDILDSFKEDASLISKRKPKSGNEINIVIASPGDTAQERNILLNSLEVRFRKGNHEKHCGFRVIVNGWEDLASQNGYAQDVINAQIISKSDFVITIFKHKLGTPTIHLNTGEQRAESGTAEELLQALDKNKENHPIGMVYFYSKAPIISLDSPDKEVVEKNGIGCPHLKIPSVKELFISLILILMNYWKWY